MANPSGSGPLVLLAYLEHNPGTGWTFPDFGPLYRDAGGQLQYAVHQHRRGAGAGYGIEAYNNNTTLYSLQQRFGLVLDILVGFTMARHGGVRRRRGDRLPERPVRHPPLQWIVRQPSDGW